MMAFHLHKLQAGIEALVQFVLCAVPGAVVYLSVPVVEQTVNVFSFDRH
jgi:hypothetical protein